MSHTPEQAKALWCPMVRMSRRESERSDNPYSNAGTGDTYVVGGCNTDNLGGKRVPDSCHCIADKCAMWRWVHETQPFSLAGKEKQRPTHGYCGLAGRPEFMT